MPPAWVDREVARTCGFASPRVDERLQRAVAPRRGRRPRRRRARRRRCRRPSERAGSVVARIDPPSRQRRPTIPARIPFTDPRHDPEKTPHMPKTVILGAARTPIGKMGGGLASIDATELGGIAIQAALERADVAPEEVQHVVMGQVLQAGQGQIPSRQAQIKAGHPQGGLLGDDQQGLRLGRARGRHPRRGDPRRRRRGRRRRRHGVDVRRPVPAAAGALRLPHGRRQGARRDGPRRPDEPVLRPPDVRRGHRGRRRARAHAPRPRPLGAALARAARSRRPTRAACPRRSSR